MYGEDRIKGWEYMVQEWKYIFSIRVYGVDGSIGWEYMVWMGVQDGSTWCGWEYRMGVYDEDWSIGWT